MNRPQHNKLASFETVQTVLTENAALYLTYNPLVKAKADLNALVLAILAAGQKQQSAGTPGVADEKAQARLDLASLAHEVASQTHAAAVTAGLKELAGRVDYSFTDLAKGRDTAVVERCTDVHAAASENLPLLVESEMDAETLSDLLQDKITAFETLKPALRHRKVKRSAATRSVKALFGEADAILTGCIDRYMVKYKKTKPEFYHAYTAARRIVSQRGRSAGQAESNVVAVSSATAPTSAPGTKAA